MGSKSSKAPKPDPNIGLAQKELAGIAKEQLDFAKQAYYEDQPRLDRYADLADQFVQSQVTAQREQSQLTAQYQQRMQGTFYPIEDTLAFDALGYYDASPEVQAKLEQAYLGQNQNLVNQRYDALIAEEEQAFRDAQRNFQANGMLYGSEGQEQDLAQYGLDMQAAKDELAKAQRYNKKLKKAKEGKSGIGSILDKTLPTFTLGMAKDAAGRTVRGGYIDTKPFKARIDELTAKTNKTQDELDELEGLQDAYARYYEQFQVNPETGKSFAEEASAERIAGLRAQRDRDLGNVGSTLDTVRAYAESYKSGQEQQAGMARQDVANQFDARSAQLQRQLASFGVDPTSGRFAQTINSNNIMQAVAEAQAMNQARNAAKQLGWAKRMDASGLGRGLPGNQATSAGLAMQQGQAGLGAQGSIQSMYGASNAAYMGGLGQAGSSFSQLGQLGLQNNAQQQAAFQQGQQGKGALTGAILGAVGTAFGGPLGGMVGSALGGAINTRNVN